MELDDFKTAWQTLDARLARSNDFELQQLRERRLDKARSSLRPLAWGQATQMLFGVAFTAFAALLWSTHPHGAVLIAAGVVVHAYGVACIAFAGFTLGAMGQIDYAAPVIDIQKRLAQLRTRYIISGMVAGLPWWFLWVPILVVLSGLGGVDLFARAPELVWWGMAIGASGLAGSWWFHRWSRSASRPRLATAMDDAATGRSLRRATIQLDEVARFERD